jgi:hypothetical protein
MMLRDLIGNGDWLNRAILSFDELSFGLPRLEAAGLVEVVHGRDGPRVRATSRARALRRDVDVDTLAGVLAAMAAAVGARPYPEPETEDRTLGPWPDFNEAMWRAELAAYRRAFRADIGKLVAGAAAVLAGVAAWIWAVVWRRRDR